MITVEHRAAHLFREDAYREYCWSVDAYGAYQPASFIYLSYESLYQQMKNFGIRLYWSNDKGKTNDEDFPFKHERFATNTGNAYGLITRLTQESELNSNSR